MGTAVIGAGSRGAALAMQLARAGNSVHSGDRDAAKAARMRESHQNEKDLNGFAFPLPLTAASDLEEMHRLPFEGKSPREAMIDLMTRSLNAEV